MQTSSSCKDPSPKAMARFVRMWSNARKKRNVVRMQELLTVHYFRYWWALLRQSNGEMRSAAEGAVETILIDKGWLYPRPPRPSETAMARAIASFI